MGSFASWSRSFGGSLVIHVLALAAVQHWTVRGRAEPRLHALVPVRIVWSAPAPAAPAAPGPPSALAVAPAAPVPKPRPRDQDAGRPPPARAARPAVPPRKPAPPSAARPDAPADATAPTAAVADGAAAPGASTSAAGIAGGAASGQAVAGGAPWALAAVARRPELVERVLPEYPPRARALELEGQVVLEVVLDREGRPEPEIRVLRSQPPFDAAALDAVRRWRFRPARDAAGQPVRVLMEIPVRFELR